MLMEPKKKKLVMRRQSSRPRKMEMALKYTRIGDIICEGKSYPSGGNSSIATSKRREIEEGTLTSRAHPAVVATESARYERVTTGICASASKAT